MYRVEFKGGIIANPVIGQEVICPDGLGRIKEIREGICDTYKIVVSTYIKNRDCAWASTNVQLLQVLQ